MKIIEHWKSQIEQLNSRIEPIANSCVDLETLEVSFDKNEEAILADVANSAQDLLVDIIDEYISANDNLRQEIRHIFVEYGSFSWAVGYKQKDNSSTEVKRYIAFISIQDQGRDTRDFLLNCSAIFDHYQTECIEYKEELASIVSISSKQDKYGMGSTATILQEWC